MSGPVIIIAAGGTGGHIFPAIATGKAILELSPTATVHYACGERPLEIELYKKHGIVPHIFPSRQLRSGIVGKLTGILAAAANTWRAFQWTKSTGADFAIGFGGYVAGPTILGALLAGCKTGIHEANSIPGKTNRILGRWMDLTAVHFESTLGFMQGKQKLAVGMPIRRLESSLNRGEARVRFNLDPDTKTILIIGGSQGAKFLYESIMKQLPALDKQLGENIQLLWSTGDRNHEGLQDQLRTLDLQRIHVELMPFISDMGAAITACDFAIARAGASAMAELLTFGKYAIYVPLPTAIYDHQRLNAVEAADHSAGQVMLETELERNLNPAILNLLADPATLQIQVPEFLQANEAAKRLASHILKMASNN